MIFFLSNNYGCGHFRNDFFGKIGRIMLEDDRFLYVLAWHPPALWQQAFCSGWDGGGGHWLSVVCSGVRACTPCLSRTPARRLGKHSILVSMSRLHQASFTHSQTFTEQTKDCAQDSGRQRPLPRANQVIKTALTRRVGATKEAT